MCYSRTFTVVYDNLDSGSVYKTAMEKAWLTLNVLLSGKLSRLEENFMGHSSSKNLDEECPLLCSLLVSVFLPLNFVLVMIVWGSIYSKCDKFLLATSRLKHPQLYPNRYLPESAATVHWLLFKKRLFFVKLQLS